jgi:hypothetical protein
MTAGWHTVITTQPFKSDINNPYDVNLLTNKPSNAGIILGNYKERRAFEKSLRKVSTHILSNVVRHGDNKSFAYHNGKIYINFVPEELPENALTYASHLTGTKLLCKEAVYSNNVNYTFVRYDAKKEHFIIEYKLRLKSSDIANRQIYLKGEIITNKKTNTSPSIYKLELLFY